MHQPKGRPPAVLSPHAHRVIRQLIEALPWSDADRLAGAVRELSRLFTRDRVSLVSRYLDDSAHAAAYLSYFMPVNLSKIQVLLDELPADPEARAGLRVLDLGSGPGTGALAVLDWVYQRQPGSVQGLSALAVDSSANALQQADELWKRYCDEASISGSRLTHCQGNLERPEKEPWGALAREQAPFDLIILANCLNELFVGNVDPSAARAHLVADLLQLLAPHGTVMVLEPALRGTSRGLHEMRDRLLQDKRCTVYSPCLHDLNCPALINPGDWCHEERAWTPPAHIREIDQEVGFIKDALKFSYLLLRKDGKTIVERRPDVFRVVSELRALKGDTRAWVCNEMGRSEVGRLDRAESEANAGWEDCRRGTIVKVDGLKRKEESMLGRIPADGTVKIVRSV